jgi:hypothetical protein
MNVKFLKEMKRPIYKKNHIIFLLFGRVDLILC